MDTRVLDASIIEHGFGTCSRPYAFLAARSH